MRSDGATLITFGCRSARVSLVGHYSRSLAQSQRRAQSLSLAGEPNHPNNKMSFVLTTHFSVACLLGPNTCILSPFLYFFLASSLSFFSFSQSCNALICGVNKPKEMWQLLLETILAQYRIKPLLRTRSVRHAGGTDQKMLTK